MINKIKCFFGYHLWTWKYRRGNTINLTEIPYNATCEHCGRYYLSVEKHDEWKELLEEKQNEKRR